MEHKSHGSPSFINIAVLLLFAIVIAVASTVTTYFFLGSRSGEQSAVIQTPIVPPTQINIYPTIQPTTQKTIPSDETVNWKVYKKGRVEIKYPSNFDFATCASNPKNNPASIGFDRAEFIRKGEVGCGIGLRPYGITLQFLAFYNNVDEAIADIPIGVNYSIGDKKTFTLNGNQFTMVKRTSPYSYEFFYFIQYRSNINTSGWDNEFLTFIVEPNYETIMNQMLSTLSVE